MEFKNNQIKMSEMKLSGNKYELNMQIKNMDTNELFVTAIVH